MAHTDRLPRVLPRLVCAVTLTVLAACAVAVVTSPTQPASLRSLSNWDLATLLPSASEVPPDWNYSLRGDLHRVAATRGADSPPAVGTAYSPSTCEPSAGITEFFDRTHSAASVHLDRDTATIATVPDVGDDEAYPFAQIIIWALADGPTRIAKYTEWLHHCGSYRVATTDPLHHTPKTRDVTVAVDSPPPHGNDVALAFTRSTTRAASQPSGTTVAHVTYYWVNGVLLEYSTSMTGADSGLMNHVVAQTLQKLRAA
jgi:hypothetical protein